MKGLGSQVAESANVTDRVRDVMVLTVPRLAIDELEPMVEPDPWMPDHGCAKRYAKACAAKAETVQDPERRLELLRSRL